jgi:hypothetical protein
MLALLLLVVSCVQAHCESPMPLVPKWKFDVIKDIFSAVSTGEDWGYAWKYVRTVTTYSPVCSIQSYPKTDLTTFEARRCEEFCVPLQRRKPVSCTSRSDIYSGGKGDQDLGWRILWPRY